jgi:hypothetical protein
MDWSELTRRHDRFRDALSKLENAQEGEDLHFILKDVAHCLGERMGRSDTIKNWLEAQVALADYYANGRLTGWCDLNGLPKHLRERADDFHRSVGEVRQAYPQANIPETELGNWGAKLREFSGYVVRDYLGRSKQTSSQ